MKRSLFFLLLITVGLSQAHSSELSNLVGEDHVFVKRCKDRSDWAEQQITFNQKEILRLNESKKNPSLRREDEQYATNEELISYARYAKDELQRLVQTDIDLVLISGQISPNDFVKIVLNCEKAQIEYLVENIHMEKPLGAVNPLVDSVNAERADKVSFQLGEVDMYIDLMTSEKPSAQVRLGSNQVILLRNGYILEEFSNPEVYTSLIYGMQQLTK